MKTTFLSLTILTTLATYAQDYGNISYDKGNYAMEGNAVYGNYNYGNHYNTGIRGNNNYFLQNDSTYFINTKVMINVQPDSYMAVFGVTQEALTVAECSKLINARLEKFKTGIKALGLTDDDIFVDLIAQTRIYDFKIVGKTATETAEGFELKKNVIISFTNHDLVEKMMILASEIDVYDIVKVEYIISDMEKIQNQLRAASLEIIENKKKFAAANSSLLLSDKGLIQYENFNTVFPNDAYRQYVAAETATIQPSYYTRDRWVKEQRKSKTFYFEKLNPSAYDKVINPVSVKVPVQVTCEIGYKFYIGKPVLKTRK